MEYPEKIATLLADMALALEQKADSDEIDLAEIAAALGCRSWEAEVMHRGRAPRINTPPQPDAVHEPLVAQALLEVFRANAAAENDDDTSDTILDGLLTNDRWRLCLNTANDARSFVRMLAIFYLGFNSNDPDSTLRALMLEGVQKISREWLHFDGAPSELTPSACVRLAFGHVWSDLFLGDAEAMPFEDLFSVVFAERPAFMPDLLPPHLRQDAMPLPAMSI